MTNFNADVQKELLTDIAETFNWDIAQIIAWCLWPSKALDGATPLALIQTGQLDRLQKNLIEALRDQTKQD